MTSVRTGIINRREGEGLPHLAPVPPCNIWRTFPASPILLRVTVKVELVVCGTLCTTKGDSHDKRGGCYLTDIPNSVSNTHDTTRRRWARQKATLLSRVVFCCDGRWMDGSLWWGIGFSSVLIQLLSSPQPRDGCASVILNSQYKLIQIDRLLHIVSPDANMCGVI